MLALVIFGILIAYLALAVYSVRATVRSAREAGLPKKPRWIRGGLVALVFYLIPFWDWIPTVVAHEYYCATEAKFEVFKTIEQWKKENTDAVSVLRFDRNAIPRPFGKVDRYSLNQRIVSDRDPNINIFLSLRKESGRTIDLKNGQVLASYVDFGTGYAPIGVGGVGAWKFWLKRDSCPGSKKSITEEYAGFKSDWIIFWGVNQMNPIRLAQMISLAEASYGKFGGNIADAEAIKRTLLNEGVSQSQIDDFLPKFSVLAHRPNTESGFSATLFEEKGLIGNRRLVLAIRGTEPGILLTDVDVLQADLGIVVEGAALYQIVDLYNYWQQLRTTSGGTVRLARIVSTQDEHAPGVFTGPEPLSTFRRIEFFDQANAGLGIVTGPVSGLVVTGHSLGGHLATAFQRLFPLIVGEVYTVNGAGTRESEIVSRFFDTLAGQFTSFDPTRITSLYGSAGFNIVAGELIYSQIGDRGEIFTESIMDVGGHGNAQMTDSAAVYDLFIRTDDRFKTRTASQLSESLANIFKSADFEAGFTLEALVNVFGKFFVADYVPMLRVPATDRDGLHARIIAVRDSLAGAGTATQINELTGLLAEQLADRAAVSDAYLFALRELSPFALLGADYSRLVSAGGLARFDQGTGEGFTDGWVNARARFLHALLQYNVVDGAMNPASIGARFEDRTQRISIGPINATASRIIFGRDDEALVASGSATADSIFGAAANDTLSGAAGNDHLEGGAGADTLDGGVGDDTLFGGAGDDVLYGGDGIDDLDGGSGFDTYIVESGAGLAVIRDSDGQGRVVLSGTTVSGGARRSGNEFLSEDGSVRYSFVGDLGASGTLTIGDDVVVENFHNGDLGIVLDGETSTDLPDPEFEYSWFTTPNNLEFDPNDVTAPYTFYGSYANDIFLYGALDPTRSIYEQGPDLGEPLDGGRYRGWGGDDQYHGAYHYRDVFSGDGGNDFIFGGDLGSGHVPYDGADDSDELYGGGGRDTIIGGKGDDALYGDFGRGWITIVTPQGWPNTVIYSANEPVELSLVRTIVLDDWYVGRGAGLQVVAQARTAGQPGLMLENEDGRGFESVLRYQLGLGDAADTEGFYDDSVSGESGDDRVFGGYGSDTLLGGDGDDFLDGDTPGFSVASLPVELRPLFGRPGDDYMDGGAGDDELRDLLGGSDTFVGGAGNDVLRNIDPFDGDEDADPQSFVNYLEGGDGDDTITSYNNSVKGFDRVAGGAGNDTITVGSDARFGGGEVFVSGGSGDDQLNVSSLNGYVDGGDGDDAIYVEGLEDDLQDDEMDGYDGVVVVGGAGDDTIWTTGRIDVDGGDGDDTIDWAAAYRQVAAGRIVGGAGNDRITVIGSANIDAGSGDDEIVFSAGYGQITPGPGRDRVVIDVSGGGVSDVVLDLTGAGSADELLFKRIPGYGPALPGQPDLLMQRAGDDLLLGLVRRVDNGTAITEASVAIPDWFAGASQLARITVEGMRSWVPADVAGLVIDVTPPDSPDPSQDEGDVLGGEPPGSPAPVLVADTPTRTPLAGAAPDALQSNDFLPSYVTAGALVNAGGGATALASVVSTSQAPGALTGGKAASDAVDAFLATFADRPDYDFSFAAELAAAVQTRGAGDTVAEPGPRQFAGQWSALHAYVDALESEMGEDAAYAAAPTRLLGQSGPFSPLGGAMQQLALGETARMGISDSSIANFRPLQGLSEGMAQLG